MWSRPKTTNPNIKPAANKHTRISFSRYTAFSFCLHPPLLWTLIEPWLPLIRHSEPSVVQKRRNPRAAILSLSPPASCFWGLSLAPVSWSSSLCHISPSCPNTWLEQCSYGKKLQGGQTGETDGNVHKHLFPMKYFCFRFAKKKKGNKLFILIPEFLLCRYAKKSRLKRHRRPVRRLIIAKDKGNPTKI